MVQIWSRYPKYSGGDETLVLHREDILSSPMVQTLDPTQAAAAAPKPSNGAGKSVGKSELSGGKDGSGKSAAVAGAGQDSSAGPSGGASGQKPKVAGGASEKPLTVETLNPRPQIQNREP